MATTPTHSLPSQAVALVAMAVGFFAIPPLARANPSIVNGFLILILFSSLLLNRDRWLPYLSQLPQSKTTTGGGGSRPPLKS